MILLDTSTLVAGFEESGAIATEMRARMGAMERLAISALVLYEWRRGPRTALQLRVQQSVFPDPLCLAFGAEDAAVAAGIYRRE